MDDVERATRSAYEGAADGWSSGPHRVYGRLAAALLDHAPVDLAGAVVLDVGAGTGVLGVRARALGAVCVDVDVAVGMLATNGRGDRVGVAADGRALPFRAGAFDLVAGNCSLSHVVDPERMLAEAVRTLRPGGGLVFSAFPADGTSHDAWHAVEAVLVSHGYERPGWYAHLKAHTEPQVGTATALRDLATAAGVRAPRVTHVRVPTGVSDPGDLADWRLGVAQHADFLGALPPDRRAVIRAEAVARIGDDPDPLGVELLVVSGRA